MGYSIVTPFETKEDKERMMKFLNEHFRSYNQLIRDDNKIYVSTTHH